MTKLSFRELFGPLGAVLVLMLSLAGSASASEIELSGIKVPATVNVAGSQLVRNGAGIRYKAIFKVYVASLYLTTDKANTPAKVVAAPGPKRLVLTLLRTVKSDELGKLFAHGIEDNMDYSKFSKLVPGVMRMSGIFSKYKSLGEGETITVDWIPGKGMLVLVNGVQEGEPFKEPEFFEAMMGIWLGKSPADWRLKDALLGKPVE
ncbi:chalcone isomerase family protein [Hydrogenophaga sp. 5NK40-0174]|uniref:chalcone isomerase family protein n=1 Tax=Hydrogenophaga sp. 5NK40-0174 TaxID=3127649 RepID=UPI003107E4C5